LDAGGGRFHFCGSLICNSMGSHELRYSMKIFSNFNSTTMHIIKSKQKQDYKCINRNRKYKNKLLPGNPSSRTYEVSLMNMP